jgi:hypothetical protein
MRGFTMSKCDPCDAIVCADVADSEPPQCPGCGAILDDGGPRGTMFNGKIWRSGEGKTKGRIADVRVAYAPQHNRDGAIGRLERTVDRRSDRYLEKVTICETGEVTHHADEPLSQHRGHGSARGELG